MTQPTFGRQRFRLIAAVPVFKGMPTPNHFVIVCQTHRADPEYVTAEAFTLDASEWWSGRYTSDLADALAVMYRAAGIEPVPVI